MHTVPPGAVRRIDVACSYKTGIANGDRMKEITRENWMNVIEKSRHTPVFLYIETPLCGTCKMGKKMLVVAVETASTQVDFPIEAAVCNINGMPELAERYGITSVPCLLVLSRGIALQRIYALQSAGSIYDRMIEILLKSKEK
jgi:thioredoxin-like negative regulator of GroEL